MTVVPAPSLPATPAPLTEPLKIRLAGIRRADGAAAGEADVASAGVLVFRGSPGAAELWDDGAKGWRLAPPDDGLKQASPLFGAFNADGGPAWEATLVAIGQKDGAGADAYKAAEAGTPSYFVRGIVTGGDGTTLGPPSPAFTFADAAAKSRFTTEFDIADTKPEAAHRVRMQLKGDALQSAGWLEIRSTPSFELEIASCDGSGAVRARVLLAASGDIRLTPAAGAKVVVDGDLEAGRILYTPAGGGPKQWLA